MDGRHSQGPKRQLRRGLGLLFSASTNSICASQTQELPSLIIPTVLLLLRRQNVTEELSWPQLAILGTFLAHYTWRSLGFPLLIRSGQPTPLSVWLLAFTFTTFNGFMQVGRAAVLINITSAAA